MSGKAERLDPMRWRGPARGSLLRLAAVAVLLATAAAALWAQPSACAPPSGALASSPPRAATPPESAERPGAPASDTPPGNPGDNSPAGANGIPPGSVGVPIRLADPTALTVVKPGNRVDLLRLEEGDQETTPVAGNVLVLDVTGADDPVTGGLLLALSPSQAELAVSGAGQSFAVLIRPD